MGSLRGAVAGNGGGFRDQDLTTPTTHVPTRPFSRDANAKSFKATFIQTFNDRES